MSHQFRIDKAGKIDLADFDPGFSGKLTREECEAATTEAREKLAELQEYLYAARIHSVLIVLQGMDTSGKDGTIAHVMQSVNPQGCVVASFKAPTSEESEHDFLWRIQKQTPAKGMIAIFNRSHYEDVLITRVHKLIDKSVWERRYEQIRQFEALLASEGTLIMKFFLRISKDEQEARLLAREKDASKSWKLATADWHERRYWDDYTKAYEDAIGATAAKHAPWYIVPANHKWYRNMVIAQTITDTLKPYKDEWDRDLKKLGEERKKELAAMRAAKTESIGKKH